MHATRWPQKASLLTSDHSERVLPSGTSLTTGTRAEQRTTSWGVATRGCFYVGESHVRCILVLHASLVWFGNRAHDGWSGLCVARSHRPGRRLARLVFWALADPEFRQLLSLTYQLSDDKEEIRQSCDRGLDMPSQPPRPPRPDGNVNLFGQPSRRSFLPPQSAGPSAQSDDAHSLYKYIDLRRVFAVNVGPPGAADWQSEASKCIKPWHTRADMATWTESLDGNSIIINVPFSQTVRISSLLINQGAGENAPRRVRLYVNRPNGLDFEDINDDDDGLSTGPPATGLAQADFLLREQEARQVAAEDRIQEYPLARFAARFAHTQSVHVVLSHSMESPCRTYYLSFRGAAPDDLREKSRTVSVPAEDAASSPMGRVKESARGASMGASTGSRGSAADGSGGQAR
ncbi:unnamed protein product [Parajaminaea phylloscopi]